MNQLEEARFAIDNVDREMAKLFEQRMQAVEEVIAYKLENKLPIFDGVREAEVIEKNLSFIGNGELVPYYEKFLHSLMDISKEYQKAIIENKK
jgi:monofunctional chorismate mutase